MSMFTGRVFKEIKDYIHAHKDNPQAAELTCQYIENLYPDLPISKQFAQELVELVQNSDKTGVLFKQLLAIAPFNGTKINPYGFDEKVYADLLLFTKLSCLMEGNTGAEINAYKLAIMFGNSNAAINYIEKFEKNNTVLNGQVVFQACLFDLPEGDDWDLDAWRAIFEKKLQDSDFRESGVIAYAAKIQKMLEDAEEISLETPIKVLDLRNRIQQLTNQSRTLEDQIQDLNKRVKAGRKNNEAISPEMKFLAELGKKQKKINNNRNTLINELAKCPPLLADVDVKLLLKSVHDVRYKYSKQDELAAYLFHKYGVPEAVFEEYLRLQSIAKNSDKGLPPVMIDGADLGLKDCYLVKLNKKDPKGAMLGHITACCQSLGRRGAAPTYHGIVSENGGFYVLCKGKPPKDGNTALIEPKNILAEAWGWVGQDGSIVLDSIESQPNIRKSQENENKIIKMYSALAYKLVTEHSVKRVILAGGRNGFLANLVGYAPTSNPVIPADYNGYRDSKENQWEAANSALPLYTLFRINFDETLKQYLALSPEQKKLYNEEIILDLVLRKATPEQFAVYLKAENIQNISEYIKQKDILYFCLILKNKALLPYLLKQGGDVNQPSGYSKVKPLKVALDLVDKEINRVMVDHYLMQILSKPGDVNIKTEKEGFSPLELAVKAELPDRVRELLDRGATLEKNQNLFYRNPETPEAQEINKILVEKWLSITSNPIDMTFASWLHTGSWSLLMFACKWGDLPLVQKLIERGAKVNSTGIDGPMGLAIKNGHKDILDFLLKNGCEVTSSDISASLEDEALLQKLLASRTWDEKSLCLLLGIAMSKDNVTLLKAVMKIGTRVEMKIPYQGGSYSLLSVAASACSPHTFASLIKNGADILDPQILTSLLKELRPFTEQELLEFKIEQSKKQNIISQYLRCLIDKAMPENDIDQPIIEFLGEKHNLLSITMLLRNAEYFSRLLQQDAKLPPFSKTNFDNFSSANKEFGFALIQAYLNSGDIENDIKEKNVSGVSLLNLACGLGSLDLVKSLVEKGATIMEEDFESAAKFGNIEVLSFLSSKSSEPFPLSVSYSLTVSHPEVVAYVLEKGAKVNEQDIEKVNWIWKNQLNSHTNFTVIRDMVLAQYEKQKQQYSRSRRRPQAVTPLHDITNQPAVHASPVQDGPDLIVNKLTQKPPT